MSVVFRAAGASPRSRLAALALSVGLVVAAGAAVAPARAEPPPIRPQFADGMAQPVFADAPVLRQDAWVVTDVDSDGDGLEDVVRVHIARPETQTQLPAIVQPSPYYAGGNPVVNHDVDVELYAPGKPGRDSRRTGSASARDATPLEDGAGGPAIGPGRYERYFVPRGFAFVYAESLGSGQSTGCPTSGGSNETAGIKAVVDWLNGRAPAYDAAGDPVVADWTTGKVGMMGVSYNGTLPNAVATTGVEGLEAIVPIAAISSWYDYYRANGAVIAPGGFQGEDEDVLAEYVLTRADASLCESVVAGLERDQDRVTGDYSPFWAERDYTRAAGGVRAAVLAVHGLNDENVRTKHVAAWYGALAEHGVPRKIWLHQRGHADPFTDAPRREAWLRTLDRWLTRWLHGHPNGVETEPRAVVQREDRALADYADWPDPSAAPTTLHLAPSDDNGLGALGLTPTRREAPVHERIVDDARVPLTELAAAARSPHRLVYRSAELARPVRVSGTPLLSLRLAFDREAANVSAALVDYRADGTSFIVNRGWTDPQNRKSVQETFAIQPGSPYRIDFDLQPDDYVFPSGSRIGIVLLSSDHEHSLRPRPGTELTLDTTKSHVTLPVVGGAGAFAAATGG